MINFSSSVSDASRQEFYALAHRAVVMAGVPPNRYAFFLLPAVLGCALDLITKAWMFSWPELRAGGIYWIWPGHAGFQLSWNDGALFGLGQGNVWLFAALSVAAGIAIPIWLFAFGAARERWMAFALGCVMGGVLGNLHDRLGLHGEVWPLGHSRAGGPVYAVRDWILWQVNDHWRWPNFNVADSLLVVGAAILVMHALRQPSAPAQSADETRSTRLHSDAAPR